MSLIFWAHTTMPSSGLNMYLIMAGTFYEVGAVAPFCR